MPRTCTICGHPQRAAIEAALVSGMALRNIAKQNGLSATALFRHKEEHIAAAVAQAQEARAEAQALDVVKQLKAINATAMAILAEARKRRDDETALKAMDRIHKQLELQAKLLGDLDERPQVNILVAPEWLAVRAALLAALAPHPEARMAVAHALAALEQRQSAPAGGGGSSNGHR
jgi:hypothetical protein